MMRLAWIGALCAGAALVGGCIASQGDMRRSGSNKLLASSQKAPEQLAGCIATAWSSNDQIGASTIRTERGWTVHQVVNNVSLAVVDIEPLGKSSAANFVTDYDASAPRYQAGVRACV